MKVFRIVAIIGLLTGPAYAQQKPELKLIQQFDDKTPQQKADDELREKFSKESKKIPQADAKTSVDPWGNVRSGDAKTSTSKTSNSKTTTSVKSRTKTGTNVD
jgi:hypothetical protein